MGLLPTLGSKMLAGTNATKRVVLLLAIITATFLAPTAGHATSARTWVANNGTNNAQCSVTTPCQTFAQAIAVTSSGGEINCLTPGDFGAVTIAISVVINCEDASNGGISVSSGPAITINTGGISVDLIGLALNGQNTAGSGPGVNITAAAEVNIRNCKIYGFVTSGHGSNSGQAISFEPNAAGGILVADIVFLANNTYGILEIANNGGANMTVRNSNINNNNQDGIYVGGSAHAGATIEQTVLSFNGQQGLFVSGAGVAVLGGSTIVNNGTGVASQSGGTVYSFKNNQIGGNGTDGTPLSAYSGGPLN